jgi:hypothetical protein
MAKTKDVEDIKKEKPRRHNIQTHYKILLAIFGFLIYTGLGYLLLQSMFYNQGYDIGYKNAENKYLENKYPLAISLPSAYPQFHIGDKLDITFEVINDADKEAYVTGFSVVAPLDGWKIDELKPELVCEPTPTQDNTTIRIIKLFSETGIIQPHNITSVKPLNFPIATKKGTSEFKFCINYADGAQVCPRILKVVVE